MPMITVITRAGEKRTVESPAGISVMEAIRNAGIDEVLALCGGCCSCATCHVYVHAEHMDTLPPMSSTENDLLDCSDHRTKASRLSCQLPIDPSTEGLTFTIAPQD